MKITSKIKLTLMLLSTIVSSSVMAGENEDAELIWTGRGSYVYKQPANGRVTNANLDQVKVSLWQNGKEKYFTVAGAREPHYTKFYKNPDHKTKGITNFLSNFEYIIETENFGKVYTNPDMNGNPMDYYSKEKKRELGIVYPVYGQAVKRNPDGRLVYDTDKKDLRLVLHRIDNSDNYYATFDGKRYEVSESEPPRTFVKEKDVQYYKITYNGTPYLFRFEKLP